MSVTVKAVLRASKKKADGTAPIWIRITANRKSRYIATGIYIEPKYWNKAQCKIRAGHDIASNLNGKLEQLVLEARKEALEADTAQAVKTALQGNGGSLTAYLQAFVDDLDAAGKFWEKKKYGTTLNKVNGCFGQEVDWKEFDRAALAKFERYLRQVEKNRPNTVRKELTRLHRVVRKAVKDGVLAPAENPFLYYDQPKGEPVNRRKLSMEEIRALEAAELSPDSWQAWARDAFLFAFYAGGMRFGDVCQLTPANVQGSRLSYRMMKTGTPVSVPLPAPAMTIANRYGAQDDEPIFPFLRGRDISTSVKLRRAISSCNALVNKSLKQVAKAAEIKQEGLSMHVARHSFADYARTRGGNLYAISKTLGHSTLQITETYLKSFDQEAVDRLAEDLWQDSGT